jgi:hypothetical protein
MGNEAAEINLINYLASKACISMNITPITHHEGFELTPSEKRVMICNNNLKSINKAMHPSK